MSAWTWKFNWTQYIIDPGMSGKRNYCFVLTGSCFVTNFTARWVFELMFLFCTLVCFFYLCNSNQGWKDCKVISGILLHSADWLIELLFVSKPKLRNSILWTLIWIQKAPKNRPKAKNVWIYGWRTVSRTSKTMFVVSEVLHFLNYNPQLQPTDVTVTLLICVRQ